MRLWLRNIALTSRTTADNSHYKPMFEPQPHWLIRNKAAGGCGIADHHQIISTEEVELAYAIGQRRINRVTASEPRHRVPAQRCGDDLIR